MSIKDKFYFALPVFAQNSLVSWYGLRLKKNRYGKIYLQKYEKLLRSQHWNQNQYEEFQSSQLRQLIEHAGKKIPYYQKTLADADIRSIGDLRKAPTLSKETVRKNYKDLIDIKSKKNGFIYINTSGSTGTPLRIPVTHEGRQANYAFFERAKRWAGIGEMSRGITFAGRVLVSPRATKPPYWRHNYFNKNLQCSSYHLSEENITAYHEAICRFKPDFLDSYPSSAYIFATLAKRKNLAPIRLKAVITSSETLSGHQRETIEEYFHCKVFDQYGNAEQAAFICQCEAGSYHVNLEYGIIELLNPGTNEPAKPGELAELVCTGFTNPAMPLIRYKIGDTAIYSDKMCACGRQSPVVEKIAGRVDDLIISRDGAVVGRLDPVFKGVAETIVESQIVQTNYENLKLKIVRGAGYSAPDGAKITNEIHKRTNYKFQITIDYVDSIPRGSNGKFRSVVSLLGKNLKATAR